MGVCLCEFESRSGHQTDRGSTAATEQTGPVRGPCLAVWPMSDTARRIRTTYRTLHDSFGGQDWWPSESPFETVIGAVLTQFTSWRNAEIAIANLRRRDALTPPGLAALGGEELEELVRPSGFFRQKARTLRSLLDTLGRFEGGLTEMLELSTPRLRSELLATRGIGPETADAILLYAAGRPTFVVDAYTRRFACRHGLIGTRASYDEVQSIFLGALPADVEILGELHALLVRLGKEYCRPEPRCAECPLRDDLPAGGPLEASGVGGADAVN